MNCCHLAILYAYYCFFEFIKLNFGCEYVIVLGFIKLNFGYEVVLVLGFGNNFY